MLQRLPTAHVFEELLSRLIPLAFRFGSDRALGGCWVDNIIWWTSSTPEAVIAGDMIEEAFFRLWNLTIGPSRQEVLAIPGAELPSTDRWQFKDCVKTLGALIQGTGSHENDFMRARDAALTATAIQFGKRSLHRSVQCPNKSRLQAFSSAVQSRIQRDASMPGQCSLVLQIVHDHKSFSTRLKLLYTSAIIL